jgi:hypothetical protein
MRLSPLGTLATNGMRIGRGNWSTWRKPARVPLYPPQIPHDLTRLEPGPWCVTSPYLDWGFYCSFKWVLYLLKVCNPFLYEWNRQLHSGQHESGHLPQFSAQLLWNTENVLTLCFVCSQLVRSKWTHRRPPGSKCDVWMREFAEAR